MKNILNRVVKEIKEEHSKPVRITRCLLSKITNLSIIKNNKLDSFPLCKEFVEEIIESYEDYYLRKIDWAVAKVREENGYIISWKVNSLLKFKTKYITQRVKNHLGISLYSGKETLQTD